MAKLKQRNLALILRRKGFAYDEIKKRTKVSKSTLSLWLRGMPLSRERIQELRGKNPKRIERFRETMRRKREEREDIVFEQVKKRIGRISDREKLISGLYLYWGEGTKSAPATTAVTNTDPDVLRFFIDWLHLFGIKNEDLSAVLHLYSDMDYDKEQRFWSTYLKLPKSCFGKAQIKHSKLSDITYKSSFGHGTCSVRYFSQDMYLFIRGGLRLIRSMRL